MSPSGSRYEQFTSRVRHLAKRRAHALVESAGLDVRRLDHGPRRTLPEVMRHYVRLGLDVRTVIDVGVAYGTPLLYDALPQAQLVLIEPLREWEGAMREIARQRQADITFAAAGAVPGSMEITVGRSPVCSSKYGLKSDAMAATRTVDVVTVDDVVADLAAPGPYLLKIDVEGAELEVLAGATATLAATELVLLEVALFELEPGRAVLHDVIGRMHELGWVASEFYDAHNRLLDGSLAMLDIAFVREDGPFRADQRYGTREQTDALYESWGF